MSPSDPAEHDRRPPEGGEGGAPRGPRRRRRRTRRGPQGGERSGRPARADGGPGRSRRRGGGGGGGPSRERGPGGAAPGRAETPPQDLPETAFAEFELPARLTQGVAAAGYVEPTPIQARLIPLALEGRDVVARSRTGTGKTCAFLLPSLARLDEVAGPTDDLDPRGPVRVLVVVPVRELAIQVAEECERLSRFLPVRTVCVYGGTRLDGQIRALKTSAVAVGTPGRLLDHMQRGSFDPSTVEVLVLDEVDRMYDLGFREDVDRILAAVARRRQTILVSATLNEDVERLIAKHLAHHERIEIESRTMTVEEVEQTFYVVARDRKRELLAALLKERDPDRTIVFVRTKFTADRVAYVLQQEGFDAHEIHSGLPQRRREQILDRFREGKLKLLVATDVAARGLDIQGVDHVINYDIPEAAEDYVHRVGRTARMGSEGWAVTFVTPDDGAYLTQIEKLINKQIEQMRFPGFELPETGRRQDAPKADETPPPPSSGIPNWTKPRRRRR